MSEKKKILVIEKVHDEGMELIKNHPNFEFEVTQDVTEANLKSKISNCDAVSIRIAKLSAEVMGKANNLKVISRHGVGYDNVDTNCIKKKGITLAITANANADSVSEHVFFMMLSISRGFNSYDQTVRSGNFLNRSNLPLSKELWNKKILIMWF